ncbi:NAD(P)-binding protein [Laetiporus sulphureus 93-53]|uniref:NAD(P)-binding protein n=1 Tax=Laetiporus sulphureus 93-53 TaxID=1314785 RepID=A0A165CLQ1_9APHY|nr:NAD(P)-binding protein [Laetiporus sulphureus 93-53]KZT03034.1 NAD(P)-binding protein [Laetiporus sulphureus 93-53]
MPSHAGVDFVNVKHHDTYPAIDPAKADLKGKVVVTGASKGIGKAIALAFAQAGVSGLVLLARSDMNAVKAVCEAAQRPGQSLRALIVHCDITNIEHVSAASNIVKDTFGRLDILVNNAGVYTISNRGTYHVTREFLPLLIECGGDKTIINLNSVAAHLLQPRFSAYESSKPVLLRFTELVMAEYSENGILAYSVHPGAIASDMSVTMPDMKHLILDTPEIASHTTVWLARCHLWDMDELLAKKKQIVDGDKLKVRMVV